MTNTGARGHRSALVPSVMALLVCASFVSCEAAGEGFLRYRMRDDPPTLDPSQALDENSLLYIVNVFDGLVEFEPGGTDIKPAVAESWDLAEDGRTYTFHLRKGVRFHNGREVTASDVVFSLKRVLDPRKASPLRSFLETIDGAGNYAAGTSPDLRGVRSPDSRTVIITLEYPYAPFLATLASQAGSIMPADVYSDPKEGYLSHPVGCGPFAFESWDHGVSLSLAAFHDHWKGAPGIPGVHVRFIPDASTALEEFKTGGLDFDNEAPAGQREWVRNNLGESYRSWPRLATSFLALNEGVAPLKGNVTLRRAISYAVDRERIARVLQEGKDTSATRLVPPGLLGSNPSPGPYHYDPKEAKRLLAEAGYPNGKDLPELVYLTPSNEGIRRYAEAVQADLAEIGVKVRLQVLEFAAFQKAIIGTKEAGPQAALFQFIWYADYPDPDGFLRSLLHSSNFGMGGNMERYSNPEVDRLLNEGRRESDPWKRAAIYRKVEELALNDACLLPMYYYGDDALVSPRVHGFLPSPLGDYAIPLELLKLSR